MRRALVITVLGIWIGWLLPSHVAARPQDRSRVAPSVPAAKLVPIDGIAVRIESDIITESQVDDLAAYQKLVDGKSQPRPEIIRELIDQWIVRGEASAAQYPQPLALDADHAFASLQKRFGSPEEFSKQCAEVGISEASVRRILIEQMYLSRFLDFRFRPAAQVNAIQVQKYYDGTLVPQLRAKGEKIPLLSDVEPEIREVLVQQAIDTLSKQWLDDTRSGLTIDVLSQGNGR